MNGLSGVRGRVDNVHCLYLDFRNSPQGAHVSVQYVLRL